MTRAKEELIMTGTDRSLSSKLERWRTGRTEGRQLPFTLLSGAGSYLDWILMAAGAVPQEHFEMIKVQPETLVGEEVTRQMERKMAKEDLLELDAGYTYDEEMKKELGIFLCLPL